jgi:hypothetical protein
MSRVSSDRNAQSTKPSPLMGVYRFPETVGGRNAWFSRGPDGSITDFAVVGDGESDARVVDRLALALYGKPATGLTLIRPRPAAASWSAGVLARVVRPRPSGGRGPAAGS